MIGKDYPKPIVDHASVSKANMARMQAAYAQQAGASEGGDAEDGSAQPDSAPAGSPSSSRARPAAKAGRGRSSAGGSTARPRRPADAPLAADGLSAPPNSKKQKSTKSSAKDSQPKLTAFLGKPG